MSAPRRDLLALTDEAIVALANKGLFKRAQRDLDDAPPEISVADDGTVTARFADATTELVAGKSLKDCRCTCGARLVCRHRVGAILAYQQSATRAAFAGPTQPWSPADIDDDALQKLLGRGALERAAARRRRGVLAEVRRGDGTEALPSVQLASCAVRFLVAGDASWARCDCTERSGCEHVALAVWAFRVAQDKRPDAPVVTVELTEGPARADRGADSRAPLDAAAELAATLLLHGAARVPESINGRLCVIREGLRRARFAWPLSALDAVDEQLGCYRRRSARYTPQRLVAALTDLMARCLAAAADGEQPRGAILGRDEAAETQLGQVRLIGLGARIVAQDDPLEVEIIFTDGASANVLVMRQAVAAPDGHPAPLASRTTLGGSTLGVIASGQVVSNAAVRDPHRLLHFKSGPLQKTSVLGHGAALSVLPEELIVRDGRAFARQLRARAPRLLRPRLLAETLRVVPIEAVIDVGFDERLQAVRARCVDQAGEPFWIELRHRAVAPNAQGALVNALACAQLQAVVGDVKVLRGQLVVEPLTVFAERPVVLDFEAPSAQGAQRLAELSPTVVADAEDGLATAVAAAGDLVNEAAHHGLRRVTGEWCARARACGTRLEALGLPLVATNLVAMARGATALQETDSVARERVAVAAWRDTALRLELINEGLLVD